MALPTVMSHAFSQVPAANIPRSSFDRSHGLKTTFDPGYLIPVFVDEVLPGDTFSVQMTAFCRLATPLKPYMDNAYVNSFFFFVPNRLVWDNWQKFNGEQRNPGDSTDFLIPEMNFTAAIAADTLGDYFGLPTGVAALKGVSALPFRAYNLIYNEWFRDQNLQNSVVNHVDDGPDPDTDYTLYKRGKRHDYFTSCLPWPQKGESVELPLGTIAPIVGDATTTIPLAQNVSPADVRAMTVNPQVSGAGPLNWLGMSGATLGAAHNVVWPGQYLGANVDLTQATAATINQLRQAFQIQKLYERDARGGTRYTEIVRSHFGVVSPDARLQRPEYLGGGQSFVNVNPVAQTSTSGYEGTSTGASLTPQGNLAAYGTVTAHGHGFSKSFTEHGFVLGFVCVRADLTYQQGLNRMWTRRTRFDHYWPALAHLGEQAVLSKEIYCDGTAGDDTVFGYQERFAEYRYKPSMITGQFRSNYAQSLDVWHLSQDFAARPLLNPAFIQENPPFDRVVAVPSEPKFIGDFYFRYRCVRPMPVYSVPGLIDHF